MSTKACDDALKKTACPERSSLWLAYEGEVAFP